MLCGALLSLFGLSVLYICVWRWDYLPVMSEMLNEPDMVRTSVFPLWMALSGFCMPTWKENC